MHNGAMHYALPKVTVIGTQEFRCQCPLFAFGCNATPRELPLLLETLEERISSYISPTVSIKEMLIIFLNACKKSVSTSETGTK